MTNNFLAQPIGTEIRLQSMKEDLVYHSKHAALLGAGSAATYLTADNLIKGLTILLLVGQLAHLGWKWWQEHKDKKRGKK